MPGPTEAFSRVLIDRALEESDWDLGDPQRVSRLEVARGVAAVPALGAGHFP